MTSELSRREFVKITSVAGGGLLIGVSLDGAFASAGKAGAVGWQPNAWLKIDAQGVMEFFLDRCEMGQGVYSSLATILAEELDVDPATLKITNAPPGQEYGNPEIMGIQLTGGSTSVKVGWKPLRLAGATARAMLRQGAAKQWKVAPKEIETGGAKLRHVASRQEMTYAQAVKFVQEVDEKDILLKDPSEFKWIGKDTERLDNRLKTSGAAVFGIDVNFPELLNAYILRSPDIGGKALSFDDSAARSSPGFLKTVLVSSGVAVICEKYWQAKRAAQFVKVEWQAGPIAKLNTTDLSVRYRKLLDGDASEMKAEGDFDENFGTATKRIEADYEVPYAAHAPMEPQNCTAWIRKDRAEVWAPTQGVGMTLDVVQGLTGLSRDQISIHSTFLGGGFGRRIAQDFVVDAVEVSMAIRRPVKVIWSREDDMKHSMYRPLTTHRLKASIGKDGKLTAWSHRIVGQCVISQGVGGFMPAALPGWMPRWMKGGLSSVGAFATRNFAAGAVAVEGAVDNLYDVPNLKIEYVYDEPGVPVGFWRSVGSSHNGFVVESFMDECAQAAGVDPIEFRLRHFKNDSPYRRVLELARDKAGPKPGADSGVYRGVAVHFSFGSYVAEICDVRVANGQIQVLRVICAVECGLAVHPDTVRAQISGGVVFGLSQTLGGSINIKDGSVVESNFHDYPIVRLNESPKIQVHIVPSTKSPTGVGEPGVPPIAAAVANAVFAASGERLRKLPLKLGSS
jgi:isoquinoline 1-oxidoreductase beta subunit